MQKDDGSTVGEHAIVDHKNQFRQACGWYFTYNPILIGGPGKVVEVDETVLTKRKYHRGQLRAEQQWFFGGVERGSSDKCFLVPVKRCRHSATNTRQVRSTGLDSYLGLLGSIRWNRSDYNDSNGRAGALSFHG